MQSTTIRKRKEDTDYDPKLEINQKIASAPKLPSKPEKENLNDNKGWSRLSWKQHCLFTIIILTIMFAFFAYYLPNRINAIAFSLHPLLSLDGPLSMNDKLASAEKLFEKKLPGPESIAVSKDGILYTALHNSNVVKIKDNEIHVIASLGKPNCSSVPECGRGLGVRLDKTEENLYVADAYHGLVKVNIKTGEVTRIFPLKNEIKVNFFDDFDILPNGDFIISEACATKYSYHSSAQCGVEGSALGRVIYYSPSTQHHYILADYLAFPNGVTLHTDGVSVLVVETTRLRIIRIYFAGDQKGKIETFAVLPGLGDNIRPASNGRTGYWVSLFNTCTANEMCYFDILKQMPRLRNLLMKMVPIPVMHLMLVTKHGMVVRVDENGRIVESLHDTSGHYFTSSEVTQSGDNLYFGSYFLPYMMRYKLEPIN